MTRINSHQIAVRWKDPKGKTYQKMYPNVTEADRARKYLNANGVSDVELAVVVKEKVEDENSR